MDTFQPTSNEQEDFFIKPIGIGKRPIKEFEDELSKATPVTTADNIVDRQPRVNLFC